MPSTNKTKTMTVYQDGKVTRTIPVSLGKPKTPSSSGIMLVMEKHRKTVFDTYEELGPEEGYRLDIEYAQRLMQAGVAVELHCWPGVFHGWELGAPTAAVTQRAMAARYAALQRALHPPLPPAVPAVEAVAAAG